MTTKINELTAQMLANAMAMPGVSSQGAVKGEDATGFSDVLDMATVKDDSTSKTDLIGGSASKSDDAVNARESMDNRSSKQIKSTESEKKDPVNNPDDKKALTKDVASKADEIKKAVKDALGVTDEEIENAMTSLGITAADLLDPQNVQSLCMELNGIEDSISLLTDAALYDNVKMLCAMANDATTQISEEYGISAEQLATMLEDKDMVSNVLEAMQMLAKDAPMTAGSEEGDFSETLTNAMDELVTNEDVSDKTNVTTDAAAGESNVKVEVTYDESTAANAAAKANEKSATDSETETFKSVSSNEEARLKGRNEGFENVSRFTESDSAKAESVVTTTVTETSFNSVGDVVETVSNYTTQNGNEILNQVTESIKVNYSADTTSMELQLHPASLGTVNMHVTSTNGIVTAHIIVENEAVKAALENQLITLQETFEAQGQKVEAVEVSIAGYDLNRGMNSETGNNSESGRDEAFRRSGVRRRINLNELTDDALDEMSEEEMIAADMMARSGNSVDFMA